MDRNVQIASLLRKALVVASKLNIEEFETWIRTELTGYSTSKIPSYRHVYGEPKGFNPYNGWMPIVSPDQKVMDYISKGLLAQSAAELEHIANHGDDALYMGYPPALANLIRTQVGWDFDAKLVIGRASIHGVLDAIRNAVLEWSIRLEKDGICGEDLSFSETELRTAAANVYNIENYLNIGHMDHSQIQQATKSSHQDFSASDLTSLNTFLSTLANHLEELRLTTESEQTARADIATINAQLTRPKPHGAVIRAALESLKTVLESAAGNVLAAELLKHLPQLLALAQRLT